jgi:hypothetical protein
MACVSLIGRLDRAGVLVHPAGMDVVVVTAGVLIGNFITVAFLWNVKKLDAPNPPVKNIVYVLIIAGLSFLIALSLYQPQ